MNRPIAGAATAAVITVIAACGCSGGTLTVKEVPAAAAAPVTHAATPAPVAASTAAGEPAPTVTRPSLPRPPRPPRPLAAVLRLSADQGGISVNSVTSCPFAENVESAWESSGGASAVTASSPATGLTYTMSCTATGTGYEVCTGGDNAYVEFPTSAPAPAPSSGQFDNLCTQCAVSTLSESVANEQQAALEAAPSYDYDSPDDASVNVALTAAGRQHLLRHRGRLRRRHRLRRHDHREPRRQFLVRHGDDLERPRHLRRRRLHRLLDHPGRERRQLNGPVASSARAADSGGRGHLPAPDRVRRWPGRRSR